MDVEHVRQLLVQESHTPGATVADMARRIGVPAMTLRRFLTREIDTPRPAQWRAFLAYVSPPAQDADAWERGALECAAAMQDAVGRPLRSRHAEPATVAALEAAADALRGIGSP